MSTLTQDLRAVRARIENPKDWTTGTIGGPGRCCCIQGGISHVRGDVSSSGTYHYPSNDDELVRALAAALPEDFRVRLNVVSDDPACSLQVLNDAGHRTPYDPNTGMIDMPARHAEVLDLIDRAIATSEENAA